MTKGDRQARLSTEAAAPPALEVRVDGGLFHDPGDHANPLAQIDVVDGPA